MLGHYTPRDGKTDYANIPPPSNLDRGRNYGRGGGKLPYISNFNLIKHNWIIITKLLKNMICFHLKNNWIRNVWVFEEYNFIFVFRY